MLSVIVLIIVVIGVVAFLVFASRKKEISQDEGGRRK